jgi:hypothetical protein
MPAVRGKAQFKSSCGFCHGDDATGNRAPDLTRSALLSHDVNSEAIAPVIRNGRPDKETPGFPTISLNARDGSVRWDIELADPKLGYFATMAAVENVILAWALPLKY